MRLRLLAERPFRYWSLPITRHPPVAPAPNSWHTGTIRRPPPWALLGGSAKEYIGNRMKLTKMLIIAGLGLMLALVAAGCGMAIMPPATAPLPSQAAPAAAQGPAATRNAYPADPRGVVEAFLNACATNAATDDVV